MTLDTDALGKLYVPFEPSNAHSGWNYNDSDGACAYFISQGSEHQLGTPTTQFAAQQTPGQDIIDSITNFALLISEVGAFGQRPGTRAECEQLGGPGPKRHPKSGHADSDREMHPHQQ